MFDVGAGEAFVILLVAVLVLGPGRLPRAIATLSEWVRLIRHQAATARAQVVEAAQLDPSVTSALAGIQDDLRAVHPRRLVADLVEPVTVTPPAPGRPDVSGGGGRTDVERFDPDAT